jgi:hypothetical protein
MTAILRQAQDGISQAVDYCMDLGTSYAIVTDGFPFLRQAKMVRSAPPLTNFLTNVNRFTHPTHRCVYLS